MGVAIIGGIFAVLLAILSWLLTNGSTRGRLLTRIERQVAVLAALPADHPARAILDTSVEQDAAALQKLGEVRTPPTGTSSEVEITVGASWPSVVAAALSVLTGVGTVVIPFLAGKFN